MPVLLCQRCRQPPHVNWNKYSKLRLERTTSHFSRPSQAKSHFTSQSEADSKVTLESLLNRFSMCPTMCTKVVYYFQPAVNVMCIYMKFLSRSQPAEIRRNSDSQDTFLTFPSRYVLVRFISTNRVEQCLYQFYWNYTLEFDVTILCVNFSEVSVTYFTKRSTTTYHLDLHRPYLEQNVRLMLYHKALV